MAAEQNIKYNIGWVDLGAGKKVLYMMETQLAEKVFVYKDLDTVPDPDVDRFKFLTRDAVNSLVQTLKAYVDPLLDYTGFWNANTATWTDVNGFFTPTNGNATLVKDYANQGLYTLKGDGVIVPNDILLRQNLPGGTAPATSTGVVLQTTTPGTTTPVSTSLVDQGIAFFQKYWWAILLVLVLLYKPVVEPLLGSLGIVKVRKRRK